MAQALSELIVGKKYSVYDEMLLMNPYQIPLLKAIGFATPCINTTYEWNEDRMVAFTGTVNGEVNDSNTTVVVDDGSMFRPKQVVKTAADEFLYITAVNDKNLTVERGYGGTTKATIADNSVLEIMFNLQEEGNDARESMYKPRSGLFNYTQIFEDTIKVSGTAQAVSEYGVDDLYALERMKVQDRLMLSLENALINGVKFKKDNIRMMGGVRQFIKTNVTDAKAAALTWDMLNAEMEKIYKNGGMKDATRFVIMVSAFQNTAITKLDENKVRSTNSEQKTGRNVIAVTTNYGDLPIIPNINLRPNELMILDLNRIKVRPLKGREFAHTYLGVSGDNIKGQVVGEYTMQFMQEEAHSYIRNLKAE